MLRLSARLLPACLQLAVPAAGTSLQSLALQPQVQQREYAQLALKNHALKAGPGRRSSISGVTATVFGATGFIGKYVVHELAKIGSQVVCPYRSAEESVMVLKQMGDLGQIVTLPDFSLWDDDQIREAISKSNVIVNCIGATKETRNFSYKDVHEDFPARLARIVAESPVAERLLHFSDIAASPSAPSVRLQTKAAGDEAMREAYPGTTIFRLAPVTGDEDVFFNNFLMQVKFGSFVPLFDGGVQRVQPTYILDVAQAVSNSLRTPESVGKTYHLAGPEILTIREVIDLVYATLGEDNDETLYVPTALAKPLASFVDKYNRTFLEFIRFSYTSDMLSETSVDKVLPPGGVPAYEDLGIAPIKVTEGLPMEMVRYCRTGGYKLGDTEQIAKNIPIHIKKYFGLQTFETK